MIWIASRLLRLCADEDYVTMLTGKARSKPSFRYCLPVSDLGRKPFGFSSPSAVFVAVACDFESWLHGIEGRAFLPPYR